MRCTGACLFVAVLLVGHASAELPIEGLELRPPPAAGVQGEALNADRTGARFTAPKADDRMEFINRDRIHGRLSAASASAGRLAWKHAAVAEDVLFDTGSLAQVHLASRRGSTPATQEALIHLTNGDSLPGRIVAMDSEILEVDAWYAGRIKINRRMVANILPNLGVSNVLFEGPNSLEEWMLSRFGGNRPQWRYAEGELYSLQQYPAGRMIEGLPDKYEARFEAAWRGSHPQFSFAFSTADVQQTSDGYMLSVGGTSISMTRYTRNTGSDNIGSRINHAAFDSNSGQTSASFVMLVDKAARSFTLLIDGSMVGQWTDPAEFAGQGNGIAFRSGSGGGLKISKIKVVPWDGRIPGAAGTSEASGNKDLVRFVNDDKFSGRVLSITDDMVKFETAYATLDVPISRVAEIVMAPDGAERARRNRDDVRAVFFDRGLLTLNLDRIEDEVLHGDSENFGSLSFPLGMVKTLEWNIYREKPEEDPEDF